MRNKSVFSRLVRLHRKLIVDKLVQILQAQNALEL